VTRTDRKYNLKLSYAMPEELPRAYADAGKFYVTIKNEGTEASPAGTWEYDLDEAGSLGFHYYGGYSLASVPAGGTARIPAFEPLASDGGTIAIDHGAIESDYVDEKVIFRFKPTGGGVWEDYASLRIYKRPVWLWLAADSPGVSALVSLPGENLALRLTDASGGDGPAFYRAYVEVPYRSDKSYLVAVTGPAGAAYAVGLDVTGIATEVLDEAPTGASANASESNAIPIQYGQTVAARLGSSPGFFRSDPTVLPTANPVLASPPAAADCSFSPLLVTLTSPNASGVPDAAAVIHYTTDGTAPGSSSPQATGTTMLSLAADSEVSAYADKPGYAASASSSWSYSFDLASGVPADPLLGPWAEGGASPAKGHSLLAVESANRLYRIGGGNAGAEQSDALEEAYVAAGATTWTWQALAAVPKPRTRQAAAWLTLGTAPAKTYLYAIGGYNKGQSPQYRAEVFAYDTYGGAWLSSEQAALPWSAEGLGACALGGRIYAAGGNEGPARKTNFAVASPNASTGAIAAWTDLSTDKPLGAARTTFGFVAVPAASGDGSGWLYAIGGRGGSGPLASVERIRVEANGDLGAWEILSSALPEALCEFACAASGGRIYVVGGALGDSLSEIVYYAEVDATSGALGAWTEDRPLRPARHYAAAAIAGGKLVVSGGESGWALAERFVWEDMLEAAATR